MLGMVCFPLGTKRTFSGGNKQPLRRELAALTYETNARGSSIWYGRASDFCPGHLWNLPWLLHQIRQRHDGRDEFTKDAPRLARLPRENSLRIPWAEGIQDGFPLRSKPPKNKDRFGGKRVNDIANFFVVQQQVEELSNFEIVHSDN